jgi:hypothetical protein
MLNTNLFAQISDTSQISCYDNEYLSDCPKKGETFYGQDGSYRINPQSLTKLDSNGNALPAQATKWSMVKDNVTGLIWALKQDYDFKPSDNNPNDADNTYCWSCSDNKTTATLIDDLNDQAFGSKHDWRLPDIKELMSIMNLSSVYCVIDGSYFEIPIKSYWSSTGSIHDPSSAWYLNLTTGRIDISQKSGPNHVIAVSGETLFSSKDLVDNQNNTITDISTGLMWYALPSDSAISWSDALSYCENLEIEGYSDWRLPNAKELISIVDYQQYSPAINTTYFPHIVTSDYWSSSTYKYASHAWQISLTNGVLSCENKKNKCYALAVRGGQNILTDSFVIHQPGAATIWPLGKNMRISWDTAGISETVKISLSREGGLQNTFNAVISEITDNDGQFDWLVAGPDSFNCVLKIEFLGNSNYSATSGLFSIISLDISEIENQETFEDTPIEVPFTIEPFENDACDMAVTSDFDSAFIDKMNVSYTESCQNRTIEIFPKKDMYGKTDITIRVENNKGAQVSSSFQLNIIPVNDCPQFTVTSNTISVEADNQTYTFNLATDIKPGPFNENNQQLYFEITSDKDLDKYFENEPTVLTSGELVFKTRYQSKIINLNINLRDNGGTDNGGCNSSQQVPVNITLNSCGLRIISTNEDLFGDGFETRGTTVMGKRIQVHKCAAELNRFEVIGKLPRSLVLIDDTISGTFSEKGTFDFSIEVYDNDQHWDTENYSIEVVDKLSIPTKTELPSAIIGQSYPSNNTITITGGKQPYTIALYENAASFSITISTDNGVIRIEDIMADIGTYDFTICVDSKDNQSITKVFTLAVVEPLRITTTRLYDGIVSKDYNMKLGADGGCDNEPYTWHISADDKLPKGIEFDTETGILSGKPEEQGIHILLFSVEDMDGHTTYAFLTLDIRNEISIENTYLPPVTSNERYQQQIYVNGGFPPYTYHCTGPHWLNIDAKKGLLQGTPTEFEQTTIQVDIWDSRYTPEPSHFSQSLAITVTDQVMIQNEWKLPVQQNKSVDIELLARGDFPPYSWSFEGFMPQGMTINDNKIVGQTEQSGSYFFTITVQAENSKNSKEFHMNVYEPLKISTSVIEEPNINKPYYQIFSTTGGMGGIFWEYIGYLPEGLYFDNKTGIITGTPVSSPPSFDFTLKAFDSIGNNIEKEFAMKVWGKNVEIIDDDIYDGIINQDYSASIHAFWGVPPYTWNIIGALPEGLIFKQTDPFYSTIQGKPTKTGIYHFTVSVSDISAYVNSARKEYTITIQDSDTLMITTQYLKEAITTDEGNYYDHIHVAGPYPKYAFEIVSGKLPVGLTLNSDTGDITGTITSESKPEEFKIKVTGIKEDSQNDHSCEKVFLLRVISPVVIKTTGIIDFDQWNDYQYPLNADDGISPYLWSIASGHLPGGLNLDPFTGLISGVPYECGEFDITIKVKDSARNLNYDTRQLERFHVNCVNLFDVMDILRILTGIEDVRTHIKGMDEKTGLDDLIFTIQHSE